MMRGPRGFFLLLAGVSLVSAPAAAQQPGVASIVERFYPPSLIASDGSGREQCFAVYDADASSAPRTIVAAFTNHSEAVIRVLRANAGFFEVVAEPHGLDLSGVWCDIQLEDIDADGRQEIRVDFSVNRSIASWLLRWDGQRLVNLTPTVNTGAGGQQATTFIDGDLLDVDGDGIKEIYVRPAYSRDPAEPVPHAMLYRLRDDHYVGDMRLVGAWKFERNTTTPETTDVAVDLPQGARGPYRLRIVNGSASGTTRAAQVQVWINGRVVVLAPRADRQAMLERAVTLRRNNTLAVQFAGRPASELLILIESEHWDSP